MANLADYKGEINAPSKVKKERLEIEYDFANDGGAVGVLNVATAQEKIIIERCYFKVNTAFTTGASGTLQAGVVGGDTDALIAVTAAASLTADAVIDEDSAGRNLVVDAAEVIALEIVTGAMTAGKGVLVIEYSQF